MRVCFLKYILMLKKILYMFSLKIKIKDLCVFIQSIIFKIVDGYS